MKKIKVSEKLYKELNETGCISARKYYYEKLFEKAGGIICRKFVWDLFAEIGEDGAYKTKAKFLEDVIIVRKERK